MAAAMGYFLGTLIFLGLIFLFLLWRRSAREVLATRITGVWQNADNTLRVLIYEMDSIFRGDIVWTAPQHEQMLGVKILNAIEFKGFKLGKGVYICPFRNQQLHFQLRLVKNEVMRLHIHTPEGKHVANEHWTLVK